VLLKTYVFRNETQCGLKESNEVLHEPAEKAGPCAGQGNLLPAYTRLQTVRVTKLEKSTSKRQSHFIPNSEKKIAKTSCSKWLQGETLVVANLSDASVDKVRSSNHTYTERGPIHKVADGSSVSQACTAHAKCQGRNRLFGTMARQPKNLGSIPRQEQGISLVYKTSRPSLAPTQPPTALATPPDVRTSGFTPPLVHKPSTVCKETNLLTCICLRSRLFSYDLGHRTGTAHHRTFRDVTPGLWGGSRETMNFSLHTRYVNMCGGGLCGVGKQ
jgi:hypothetical protein